MATTNWPAKTAAYDAKTRRIVAFWRVALCILAVGWNVEVAAYDAPPSSLSPKFTAYALSLLKEAKDKHEAAPKDAELAWKLGKAYFFAGEFATNKTTKANLAEAGIAACEIAITSEPKSAEAHYYYALNQGQLARTKLLAALSLVRQMKTKLAYTANTKPEIDHAGADRCLALLFRDAPGWPISVGDTGKSRAHLAKLKKLAPDFPENVLVWLETWIKWKDTETLAKDLPSAGGVLEAARKKLSGREWEAYWDDWDRRWTAIQEQAKRLIPQKE